MNRFELLPGSLQQQNGVFSFINTGSKYFSVQGRESTQRGVAVSPACPEADLHCWSAVLSNHGFEAWRKCMELFKKEGRVLTVGMFWSNAHNKFPFLIWCDFWAWNPCRILPWCWCSAQLPEPGLLFLPGLLHPLALGMLWSGSALLVFSQPAVALAALVFLLQASSCKILCSI